MVRVKYQELYTKCNNNNDIKTQLVIDTYNVYKNSHSSCIHRFNSKSSFIDWYLIFKVAEDSSIDTIRKQYRKLALLLHPDKNKHPKAEFAFKLISQAYKCLSDDAKRTSFNIQRWRNQCTECSRTSDTSISTPPRPQNNVKGETSSSNSFRSSRSTCNNVEQHLRSLREHLKEEARVIESCIRINRSSKDEYPVFDPSSYSHLSYPHRRNQHPSCNSAASPWSKEKMALNSDQRRSRCEQPIFQLRAYCDNFKVSPACVSS